MADPTVFFPYHDPYDNDDLTINFTDDSNPNLADLNSLLPPQQFPQYHSLVPQSADHKSSDQIMWNVGGAATRPPQIRGPTSNGHNPQQDNNVNPIEPPNTDHCNYGNAQILPVWPAPPLPYTCSCCQILREIIHTNRNHTMKLEIHGRLGMISHAVLVNQFITNETCDYPQMFDFCDKSTKEVKQFLVEYCAERAMAGYMILQDPLSIFYETICVGMDWDMFSDDFFLPQSPSDSGEACQVMDQTIDRSAPKTSLAAQRERTGKLALKDLVEYFHLPIEEAARKLNLCPTVVKKICRKGGLSRWPHRKIKSISRQMSCLRENLDSYGPRERAIAEAEIARLQQEITNICGAGVHR